MAWNVNAINKRTKEKIILESGLTEGKAETFCEMWGWMYTDENNIDYWLEMEEVKC